MSNIFNVESNSTDVSQLTGNYSNWRKHTAEPQPGNQNEEYTKRALSSLPDEPPNLSSLQNNYSNKPLRIIGLNKILVTNSR